MQILLILDFVEYMINITAMNNLISACEYNADVFLGTTVYIVHLMLNLNKSK